MKTFIREFFLLEGWQRPIEGYFSWQHLTFVTVLMILMVGAAVFLGRRNKVQPEERKKQGSDLGGFFDRWL